MLFAGIYLLGLLFLIHYNFFGLTIGLLSIIFFAALQSKIGVIIAVIISCLFCMPIIRRQLVSRFILYFIKKLNVLPKISDTEKIALDAGTVWIESEFFRSTPNMQRILEEPFDGISKEEQSFMDNEVEELCAMVSDFDVFANKDLPAEAWDYLKKKKFFGMIIPKKYGGLDFSANGQSAVVGKIGSRCQVLSITTMVPNSLGPAELILKYGTEKQKEYYLPRLADGREIPCFGLTEPFAGSDATSISSHGELFKDEDGELKIRLNFEKRYITLGGIATVIGLAFQLKDPQNLLPGGAKLGITCALLKGDLPGITRGKRHMPMYVPFINSPIYGKDVIISVEECVIGGEAGLGEGWKMLMECLSVGRGVSLPAISAAAAKYVTQVSLMYSSLRRQFGSPIIKFEGIEEVLTRMIANCYAIEAMRIFTATAVKNGHKPGVANAIAKYHSTEISRTVVNDAMDILGGSAICVGPNNLIAHAYMGIPIGITVEGANIMTRTLLQFGQGLMRCHPFLYNEMMSIQSGNLGDFDSNFWGHFSSFIVKRVRCFTLKIKQFVQCLFGPSLISKYSTKMEIASARFGFLADLILLIYGGGFKIRERLSGRFGDIVSNLYIASAVLRKFKEDGEKEEIEPMAIYSLEKCFSSIDKAFDDIHANISQNRVISSLIKAALLITKPTHLAKPISDKISKDVVNNVLLNEAIFKDLFSNTFVSDSESDRFKMMTDCFKEVKRAGEIIKKVKKEKMDYSEAVNANIITSAEYDFITVWESKVREIVQVDDFPLESNAFSIATPD